MTAKRPLSGSSSTPKSAWNFTALPSPQTPVSCPFENWDEALGLTDTADGYLQESRTGRNIRHHLIPLIRQSIYSRLAGYDDTNDAQRLAQDPAMRVIVGWQGSDRNAASTSEMGRFETETLIQEDNLKGLARMKFPVGGGCNGPHPTPASDSGHGQFGESSAWPAGREPPTTGTSSVSAIIPSFYSTSSEIAKERRYDPGTSPAPMAGRNSLSRW